MLVHGLDGVVFVHYDGWRMERAVQKIVSGGQTGADRAALDWAIERGIPHGGWCPKGRKAEDGPIHHRYKLVETPSASCVQRTEWNLRDSDGTVIFSIAARLAGGSKRTLELARKHRKPVLRLSPTGGLCSPELALKRFIRQHHIGVLNVAGSRGSEEPEVAEFVKAVLEKAFGPTGEGGEAETSGTQQKPVAQPTLETARLILRPYAIGDAATLARLAGAREIADTTISIPHPYSERQARDWICRSVETRSVGEEVVFAVAARVNAQLVGGMGLREIDREHSQAEMGFWIAVDCWGRGYATEAARALLRFGFEGLDLNRIYAHHMLRNPASGRVLEKIGMKKEGILRERVRKWGVFEDVAVLAILKREWDGQAGMN